jgi:hypothetical protein
MKIYSLQSLTIADSPEKLEDVKQHHMFRCDGDPSEILAQMIKNAALIMAMCALKPEQPEEEVWKIYNNIIQNTLSKEFTPPEM